MLIDFQTPSAEHDWCTYIDSSSDRIIDDQYHIIVDSNDWCIAFRIDDIHTAEMYVYKTGITQFDKEFEIELPPNAVIHSITAYNSSDAPVTLHFTILAPIRIEQSSHVQINYLSIQVKEKIKLSIEGEFDKESDVKETLSDKLITNILSEMGLDDGYEFDITYMSDDVVEALHRNALRCSVDIIIYYSVPH